MSEQSKAIEYASKLEEQATRGIIGVGSIVLSHAAEELRRLDTENAALVNECELLQAKLWELEVKNLEYKVVRLIRSKLEKAGYRFESYKRDTDEIGGWRWTNKSRAHWEAYWNGKQQRTETEAVLCAVEYEKNSDLGKELIKLRNENIKTFPVADSLEDSSNEYTIYLDFLETTYRKGQGYILELPRSNVDNLFVIWKAGRSSIAKPAEQQKYVVPEGYQLFVGEVKELLDSVSGDCYKGTLWESEQVERIRNMIKQQEKL